MNEEQLQTNVNLINELELAEETKALALTAFYIKNNRVNDAIQTLENLVNNRSQTAGVYRILGDLYLHGSLSRLRLAQKHYQQTLDLTVNQSNSLERIAAMAGLAEIQTLTGNQEKAQQMRGGLEVRDQAQNVERKSVIETALSDLRSKNTNLADLISLQSNCEVRQCRMRGDIVKPTPFAYCIECGIN